MWVECSDQGDTIGRFPFSGLYTFFLCQCEDVLHFSLNFGLLVVTCYKEISVFNYPFLQCISGRAYSSQSQCLAVWDALFKVWWMC